eukprot:s1181_g11.t1
MLRGLSKENLPAEWLVATLCACTVSLLRAKSHRSSRAFPAHRDRGAMESRARKCEAARRKQKAEKPNLDRLWS